MKDITPWLDKWTFVVPKRAHDSSGNGITYTFRASRVGCVSREKAIETVKACMDGKRLVLMRTPDNAFGQQEHDDWFTALTAALDYPLVGFKLAWWSVIRLGYMKNVPWNLAGRKWLGRDGKIDTLLRPWHWRYPHIWPMIVANMFPVLPVYLLCGLFLDLTCRFDKIDPTNASGVQLQFDKAIAADRLGIRWTMDRFLKNLDAAGITLTGCMIKNNYWDADHAVLEGYDAFQEGWTE
jgi:hypothetical protein